MGSFLENHKIIADLIDGENIVYGEMPVYDNIGDLLIMLGSIEFFKKHNIHIKKFLSVHDFFPNENTFLKDVIVLQGGGNLGDLYPLPQKFRESIIGNYLSNRIIILPQIIYFDSRANYYNCCNIFSKHSDLHIFVRDKQSYKLALRMSSNVYLAPDMAHQLHPIDYPNKRNKKILFLRRADEEALYHNFNFRFDAITDWKTLIKKHAVFIKLFDRFFKTASVLKLGFFLYRILPLFWIFYSKLLISKAIKLFAEHEIIITDRLHGHILSCLMNKKNIVFDNSYGKNSLYIELWTKNNKLVTLGELSKKTNRLIKKSPNLFNDSNK